MGRRSHLRSAVAYLHLGHIAQQYGSGGCGLDKRAGKCAYIIRCEYTAYDILVAVLIEYSSCHIAVHAIDGLAHLVERHSVMSHTARIEKYLVFAYLTAKHRHLRYASCCEQPWTHGPVGNGSQVL